MTKADIVNEITKKTGIDKQTVLTTVEEKRKKDIKCLRTSVKKD